MTIKVMTIKVIKCNQIIKNLGLLIFHPRIGLIAEEVSWSKNVQS